MLLSNSTSPTDNANLLSVADPTKSVQEAWASNSVNLYSLAQFQELKAQTSTDLDG